MMFLMSYQGACLTGAGVTGGLGKLAGVMGALGELAGP